MWVPILQEFRRPPEGRRGYGTSEKSEGPHARNFVCSYFTIT